MWTPDGVHRCQGQRADRCDRACLEGLLDRYVEALVAHDPSRLPLASDVKFTENGQRLTLGDGAWHTVTGKGAYRLPLADVEAGQAVLIGTIREADTPTVFVLRLQLSIAASPRSRRWSFAISRRRCSARRRRRRRPRIAVAAHPIERFSSEKRRLAVCST